jgi:hypothetical protein
MLYYRASKVQIAPSADGRTVLQMGVSSAVSSLLPHETSLANFAADMPATTPLVNLSAALHEAVPALNRVPYGATLGDAYVTWMTGLK